MPQIRRTGYQGVKVRQTSPNVATDQEGSDRVPHLDTTAFVPDGSITNNKLAANSVTSDKILDGTIVAADIAPGTVESFDRDPGFGETSGTLPLPTFTSGVSRQIDTTCNRFLSVPFTITGGGSGSPTVTALIQISPDNVTFTSAGTWTWPDGGGGVSRNGIIFLVALFVPKSWWVKFTTSGISIGTGLWY